MAERRLSWENVVGDKTIESGGYTGDLLELGRKHLDEAAKNGRITAEEYGKVISTMISSAYTQAIRFELDRALREAEIDIAYAKLDNELLDQALKMVQHDTARYDLNYIKPEEAKSARLKNEIAEYDLDNIKPEELKLIKAKNNSEMLDQTLRIVQHDTARYELTYLKPEELRLVQAKLVTEDRNQALLGEKVRTEKANVGKTEAERNILRFESDNIKPEDLKLMQAKVKTAEYEQDFTEQKSIAEKIKNGLEDTIATTSVLDQPAAKIDTSNSIYKKQTDTHEAQEKLFIRQTESFDDAQLQNLFNTQTKYSSMVAQEVSTYNLLEIGQDAHVANIYNAMVSRINSHDEENEIPDIPRIKGCELTDQDCAPCIPSDNSCPNGSQ